MDTFSERWTHFRKDGHIFGKMDTKRKDWTQNGKIGHIFGKMDTKRKDWTFLKMGNFFWTFSYFFTFGNTFFPKLFIIIFLNIINEKKHFMVREFVEKLRNSFNIFFPRFLKKDIFEKKTFLELGHFFEHII
jgi:hypothetical protein